MVKLYAAMELYKKQKLSMGKAAEMAEMDKTDFMFKLGEYGIPVINYDVDDFLREVEEIMGEGSSLKTVDSFIGSRKA